MDTSKEYIKMCEKAGEVQISFPEYNCMGTYKQLDNSCFITSNGDFMHSHIIKVPDNIKIIWLPRQDQLQDMVSEERTWDLLIHDFYEFCKNDYALRSDVEIDGDVSMEQLWLAFVMKKKFNKSWNGTDWVTTH